MVLIVDDSAKKRKTVLRFRFLEANIPCAVCNTEQLKKLPYARFTVVYAENESQISLASIRAGETELIVINETGRYIFNPDAHFYDKNNDGDITDYVVRRYYEKYGLDFPDVKTVPVEFSGRNFLFRNEYVVLTVQEKLIIRFLAMADTGFHPADEISRYTDSEYSPRHNSIPQHISNINKKATEATRRNVIIAKRGSGYMLDKAVGEIKKQRHYSIKSKFDIAE